MYQLEVEPPILIHPSQDLLFDEDFVDLIKRNINHQKLGSAQGVCKFLVFEIPEKDHKVNEDAWDELIIESPQTFEFSKKIHGECHYWQRIKCSPNNPDPVQYRNLKKYVKFTKIFDFFKMKKKNFCKIEKKISVIIKC